MINQDFLELLAKMESVASDSDKKSINAFRGRYASIAGSDDEYIGFLAKLENAASTDEEKEKINEVRGRYAMLEMCTTETGKALGYAIYESDMKERTEKIRAKIINEAVERNLQDSIDAINGLGYEELLVLNTELFG